VGELELERVWVWGLNFKGRKEEGRKLNFNAHTKAKTSIECK
jgi:hypothetical protein